MFSFIKLAAHTWWMVLLHQETKYISPAMLYITEGLSGNMIKKGRPIPL